MSSNSPTHAEATEQPWASGEPEVDDTSAIDNPMNPAQLAFRPPMTQRISSGSIIIPRDSQTIEMEDEQYEPGDARAMSPRRSMEQVERMGDSARKAMEAQARTLQANLLEIVDRVEAVKTEHEKLEGGNKFLQSYIGELMQTSKITSTGGPGSRARGRN